MSITPTPHHMRVPSTIGYRQGADIPADAQWVNGYKTVSDSSINGPSIRPTCGKAESQRRTSRASTSISRILQVVYS